MERYEHAVESPGRTAQMTNAASAVRGHSNEFRYYIFGLYLGLLNLLRNGMRLGLMKTIGKITQPINSYTRFPEYYLMDEAIQSFSRSKKDSELLRILDVGSPKCFGLYLASKLELEIEMTDINSLNIDEYKTMWEAVRPHARGRAHFALEDARSLSYPANHFDVVYSMSVLEHIEGQAGDRDGLREMARVLKPGGLLLLSVPFGGEYVEQQRKGLAHAVEKKSGGSLYFFQRIYDIRAIERRIFPALGGLSVRAEWTVWRERELPVRLFKSLGEYLGGALGFLNPWLSLWSNRYGSGIVEAVSGSYGQIYSTQDSYGDFVLAAQKGCK